MPQHAKFANPGLQSTIHGTLTPIGNRILVKDMHFGETKSKGGIILMDDDGKNLGVHPRWAQVWAIGKEQEDVEVGQWVLVAHGRWSRGVKLVQDEDIEDNLEIRMIDEDDVMLKSWDTPPQEDYIMAGYVNTGGNLQITAEQSQTIAKQKASGQATAGYYSSSTAKPYTYRKKKYRSTNNRLD